MKSFAVGAAALCFLLAIPLAFAHNLLVPNAGELMIHFAFAAGAGILATQTHLFTTPSWTKWLGRISLGLLAMIFALQGISDAIPNATLRRIAFEVLGQGVEGIVMNLFLLWCVAVAHFHARGAIRTAGLLAALSAIAVRSYAIVLSLQGGSLDATAPVLKLFYLLPFVWLLVDQLITVKAISRQNIVA